MGIQPSAAWMLCIQSKSTQQHLWLSPSLTPFQPDNPFTPFKLQSCIHQFPGPFAQSFSKLFYALGLYYHLVFQSLCLPASLPSITLSDRIQIAVPVSTSPNHLKVILKHSCIISIATFIYYFQKPLTCCIYRSKIMRRKYILSRSFLVVQYFVAFFKQTIHLLIITFYHVMGTKDFPVHKTMKTML